MNWQWTHTVWCFKDLLFHLLDMSQIYRISWVSSISSLYKAAFSVSDNPSIRTEICRSPHLTYAMPVQHGPTPGPPKGLPPEMPPKARTMWKGPKPWCNAPGGRFDSVGETHPAAAIDGLGLEAALIEASGSQGGRRTTVEVSEKKASIFYERTEPRKRDPRYTFPQANAFFNAFLGLLDVPGSQ